MKPLNLAGHRFGRWFVVKRAFSDKRYTKWNCLCDCGTEKIIVGSLLKSGHSKSCGCLRGEKAKYQSTTHGLTRLPDGRTRPEYSAWHSMKQRCLNVRDVNYANYGGRGITICEQWKSSFLTFLADVGYRPASNFSLDRIDNDGNYEPSNIRWATKSEQRNNQRHYKRGPSTRPLSPEQLAKRAAAQNILWSNPEWRSKRIRRTSEASKLMWSDPAFRVKMRIAQKKAWIIRRLPK